MRAERCSHSLLVLPDTCVAFHAVLSTSEFVQLMLVYMYTSRDSASETGHHTFFSAEALDDSQCSDFRFELDLQNSS